MKGEGAGRADLHVHSAASDGVLAPAELVRRAVALGLAGLALTDHDTQAGLAEARAAARGRRLVFVPGIELSAEDEDGVEVHILGYGVPESGGPLAELLERMRAARAERMARMIERLRRSGLPVEEEDVAREAGGAPPGRPHLARVLVRMGRARDVADAFDRYLAPGRPGYEPRPKLSPEAAVRSVRAAGGVAVWAHPGPALGKARLSRLVAAGLGGIECFHPDMTAEDTGRALQAAEAHGLAATGGSDFHAEGERVPLGSVTVPVSVALELLAAARHELA
ncbi:MAG: PHP domain-containing protein [Clostridia bacterium]|nr:PHP domain-containing protein [Clostridia bacterium]